jgi:multicomponent Na+:H+ antiporter subunit D
MFGGALLALAQKNVRRMLAFSTIDDMGYLLLGLAAGTVGGVLGAAIGAIFACPL